MMFRRCCRKQPKINRSQMTSYESGCALKAAWRLLDGHSLDEEDQHVDRVIAGVAVLGMLIDDWKYPLYYEQQYPLTLEEVLDRCGLPKRFDYTEAILKIGEQALEGKLKFDGVICMFPCQRWQENADRFAKRLQKYFP